MDEHYAEVELVEEEGFTEGQLRPNAGEAAVGESEPKSGRRRRRRRRRGGKRPGEPSGERTGRSQEPTDATFDEDDATPAPAETVELRPHEHSERGEGEDRPRKRRRRRGRRKGRRREGEPEPTAGERTAAQRDELHTASEPEEDEEQPTYDVESDGAEPDDDESDIGKPSHRGIPHWEEAVGMIIAANMEARAKNPNASSAAPRARRGRGRGRGR
jgi:ribonuclease E